jgi:hypothetical protein
MNQSRRNLHQHRISRLGLVGQATAEVDIQPEHRQYKDYKSLEADLQTLFADLPGRKAFKIWAPATEEAPELLAKLHSRKRLFQQAPIKL